jgi:hypothetical protein
MNEPIVLNVIEPKNRHERRAVKQEINRAVSDYNEIENIFIEILFNPNSELTYLELYEMALKDWANISTRNYKINRFFYTCPNIRYFEEKYKPLENGD